MKQYEIADAFDQIANYLEMKGENPFRIRAYRRASLNLRGLTEDLQQLADQQQLRLIPGIGEDLSAKIVEYLKTGRIEFLERLRKQMPESVSMLMTVPGIGPKTAKLVYDKFKIKSIEQLEALIQAGKLHALKGLGEKKEQNILQGIQLAKAGQSRMPLGIARALGQELLAALKGLPQIKRISLAGSLRRCRETVRDIDILITSNNPAAVMEKFVNLYLAGQVQAHGETKSSIRTKQGVQVDLRVVEPESFGAALVYFTGSKEHNVKIRGMALKMGLTVNEYGVFRIKGHKLVAGREEEDVYKALGLAWVPPELREDRGEVEAAASGKLPRLAELKQFRGDFHIHSTWSDGHNTIENVARAAKARGYGYIVLTDHSQSLKIANGLTEERLARQHKEIDQLNTKLAPFRILKGAEVDILLDGRLDYPDRVLEKLDVVIASVHSGFKQPGPEITARIVKAVKNRHVAILGHPTGRKIGTREPYAVDLEQVFRAAAQSGTALEMNSYTDRLDLNDSQARRARELGAKLVVSTDTHAIEHLAGVESGLALARRAWLGPGDLLNTLDANQLLAWIAKKRGRKAA